MTFILPTIYPITDRRISGLSHIEQVRRLIDGGATLIQLREKEASSREFLDAAVEAVEFARAHSVSVLINDRVDIAIAINAAGIHLGQKDMSPEKARPLLGDAKIIGFSTHSLEQAKYAATLPIDYIAYGPIFPTRTKVDPDSVVGLAGIHKIRKAIGDMPLVAIGGIGAIQIRDVLAAGADSAALINAIVGDAANITEQFRDLAKRFNPKS